MHSNQGKNVSNVGLPLVTIYMFPVCGSLCVIQRTMESNNLQKVIFIYLVWSGGPLKWGQSNLVTNYTQQQFY